MPRTGRRPGSPRTREAILAAARQRFARDGYRGATVRRIGADAGVDPALIHHYFGSKQALFAAVLDIPVLPAVVVEVLGHAPPEELGARIMATFLDVWDQPAHRDRLRILLQTVTADDAAATGFREFLGEALLGPLAQRLGAGDARLRVALVASQLVGFAVARYVLALQPLASAAHDELVALYAPTLQRYLTGSLAT